MKSRNRSFSSEFSGSDHEVTAIKWNNKKALSARYFQRCGVHGWRAATGGACLDAFVTFQIIVMPLLPGMVVFSPNASPRKDPGTIVLPCGNYRSAVPQGQGDRREDGEQEQIESPGSDRIGQRVF